MDSEIKLVLLISESMLYDRKKEIRDLISRRYIHWEIFFKLLQYHELAPVAYILLKDVPLPEDVHKILENAYYFNLAHNILLWEEFLKISKVLNDHDITFAPLKGFSFMGEIYPDINYRSMADIDIMVKEEDLKLVGEILQNLGYSKQLGGLEERYWREKQCHIAYVKPFGTSQKVLIEVHWDLDFKRLKQPILPLLWTRLEKRNMEGVPISFLSIEDSIFSLVLHKRRLGNIFSLKGTCDLACLLKKFSHKIDWEYILKWSRVSKMRTVLYFSLFQTRFISSNLFSEAILDELKIPLWKRLAINKLILRYTFATDIDIKKTYLRAHFFLYDSIWEAVRYILNIPREQFAKFYNLEPYSENTKLLYRMRLLYFPLNFLVNLGRRGYEKQGL
ncbi:MAG: nucleotidyltransferase family protein [Candidatus Omnitrophota bacterium]